MPHFVNRLVGEVDGLSIKIMSEVWEHSKLRGSQLLLLLALADNAKDETREAWPGTAYLARKTRLSVRAIHRLISELEASKELSVERNRGRNRVNLFRINEYLPEENVTSWHVLEDSVDTSAKFGTNGKGDNSGDENVTSDAGVVTNHAEKVTSDALKGDTPATGNHKEPLEPLIEPLIEPVGNLKNSPTHPEWFEVLQNLKYWGNWSFAHCQDYISSKGLSEIQLNRLATEMRDYLDKGHNRYQKYLDRIASGGPKKPVEVEEDGDPWKRFGTWINRKLEEEEKERVKNPAPSMVTGGNKFEEAKALQEARKQEVR